MIPFWDFFIGQDFSRSILVDSLSMRRNYNYNQELYFEQDRLQSCKSKTEDCRVFNLILRSKKEKKGNANIIALEKAIKIKKVVRKSDK